MFLTALPCPHFSICDFFFPSIGNVTISDSRVNKAGRLKALYVKTEKVVLFEVKPHVRIPIYYFIFLINLWEVITYMIS